MPHRNATLKTDRSGSIRTARAPYALLIARCTDARRRKGSRSKMKPELTEKHDQESLAELGRAAVQIVHDLKNQINGLKLYATFLRKRLEKGEGHADELETVAKLNAGLERAAADMSALVRYGRTLELRCAPHVDLRRVLATALERESEADAQTDCYGAFDQTALAE